MVIAVPGVRWLLMSSAIPRSIDVLSASPGSASTPKVKVSEEWPDQQPARQSSKTGRSRTYARLGLRSAVPIWVGHFA
jgi:hypothetical protein